MKNTKIDVFAVLGNNLVWEKQTYTKKYDAGQAAVSAIIRAETILYGHEARNHRFLLKGAFLLL